MPVMTDYFSTQLGKILNRLERLVEMESPSNQKRAVDAVGAQVSRWLCQAGARVERIAKESVGDPILGKWNESAVGNPILLLCHMDTVWPIGTLTKTPRRDGDRLYGPGVYDMKAGIVLALAALEGVASLALSIKSPIWLLCTGDEEIGSLESRDLIEKLARMCRLVLCLEPALPGGALKTFRKGVGSFHIRALGRAAHAGGNHERGINAIEELAHQVLALQALTDYQEGLTVNVGIINGGTAENIVPPSAEILVDYRIENMESAEKIVMAVQGLVPYLPGARLEINGGLNRPPMMKDALMRRSFEQARQIARRQGIELREGGTGGGSDANFTAALGIPTLDGLGADGDGAHAIDEHIIISSLPDRAALIAALIAYWPDKL